MEELQHQLKKKLAALESSTVEAQALSNSMQKQMGNLQCLELHTLVTLLTKISDRLTLIEKDLILIKVDVERLNKVIEGK
ncbi:hypothetical protein [Nitrospira sp. BLG_2]|uniref:hypothetical protein n=1 Tax=Nitrospira sp. BLG_2 TaxID=3397507 RepID=UPI003B99DA08